MYTVFAARIFGESGALVFFATHEVAHTKKRINTLVMAAKQRTEVCVSGSVLLFIGGLPFPYVSQPPALQRAAVQADKFGGFAEQIAFFQHCASLLLLKSAFVRKNHATAQTTALFPVFQPGQQENRNWK